MSSEIKAYEKASKNEISIILMSFIYITSKYICHLLSVGLTKKVGVMCRSWGKIKYINVHFIGADWISMENNFLPHWNLNLAGLLWYCTFALFITPSNINKKYKSWKIVWEIEQKCFVTLVWALFLHFKNRHSHPWPNQSI